MSKIRVRIAPSPTGLFHLGSLRTALTNYLFAHKERGSFILRVEDTDQSRLVPEAIPDMLESLRWAGIETDEGVVGMSQLQISNTFANTEPPKNLYDQVRKSIIQKGNFGPYVQSERRDIYKRYLEELLRKNIAYPCFCSPARLAGLRKKFTAQGLPPKYDRHCLNLSASEIKNKMAKQPYVIRLKVPSANKTSFNDIVRGKIEMENRLLDDPVLMKSDGFPTYHFAVVVDDHLMRISHIFRGEEWISSTPKHILIYKAFGWDVPAIGHLTNILNMKGGKLSKRDGDVSIADFRQKGYLPEAIINFIALLGWNPKSTKEIFSLLELIREFDVQKLNKAAPKFDQRRLEWFGSYYIRQKPVPELAKLCQPYLANLTKNRQFIEKIVTVQQPRMNTLADVTKDIEFAFKMPAYSKQLLKWRDMEDKAIVVSLRRALQVIEKIPANGKVDSDKRSVNKFNLPNLEKLLMKAAGTDRGTFLWPLRAALTGQQKSPSPFECAWMLGKEETIERLKKAIRKIA